MSIPLNAPSLSRAQWGVVIAALLLIAGAWFTPLQSLANQQVDAGLKRALITFASARTLNGLISVLQGTEFSVQPFGVGVTLTVGQILDPVNDLVEQFSSLMLFASVAFGVQKVLLALGGHWVVSAMVTLVAAAWAAAFCQGRTWPGLTRLVLVLFMVRLAMPLVTITGDLIFQRLLADEYTTGQASLLSTSRQIDGLTPRPSTPGMPGTPADKGLIERFKDGVATSLPSLQLDAIRQAAENLPERIIKLIVVFLMQTVALPLLLLWVLVRLVVGAGAALHAKPP